MRPLPARARPLTLTPTSSLKDARGELGRTASADEKLV